MSHLIASLRVPARRQSHWAIRLNITHQNPFRCVSQNRSTPNINPEANSNKPQEKHNVYTSQRSYGRAGMPPVHLKIPPTPTPVSLSGHLNVVQDHPLHAPEEDEFWRKIPMWKDVSKEQFMSYQWSVSTVHTPAFGVSDFNVFADEERGGIPSKVRPS